MFQINNSLKAILAFALLATTGASASMYRTMADEIQEGYDVESPEAIAAARAKIEREFAGAIQPNMLTRAQKSAILEKYNHLDPKREVPTDLLEKAVLYFDANASRFPNQSHITILDFKKRSNLQRFFLINMQTGAVEKYRTTHGLNSDKNDDGYAESFGNVINSGKSSLGFIRTGEVYWGKFKRSIRLDGLESTNSNVRARAIVFHGWDKVKEANVKQGLSWGCPTLDWSVKDAVLDKIKEGSLMYIGVSK